jgi:hypothetical protein
MTNDPLSIIDLSQKSSPAQNSQRLLKKSFFYTTVKCKNYLVAVTSSCGLPRDLTQRSGPLAGSSGLEGS